MSCHVARVAVLGQLHAAEVSYDEATVAWSRRRRNMENISSFQEDDGPQANR